MTRERAADRVEALGIEINEIRQKFIAERQPYTAGILRSAEEALLIVVNTLRDINIPDSEL